MISVFPANSSRTLRFDYIDADGNPVAPQTANYVLYDQNESEVVAETTLTITGSPTSVDITIGSEHNTLGGSSSEFRKLLLTFTDAEGNTYQLEQHYILEPAEILSVGNNTFATFGNIMLTALNVSETEAFNQATVKEQKAALINAWYNIGDVPLTNLGLDQAYQSKELTSALLGELDAGILERLVRAQIIEANFILGGNPVEDRRRTGMISDSSGESAQFFRTSRPVELPICKAAANALRGHVNWSLKLSR